MSKTHTCFVLRFEIPRWRESEEFRGLLKVFEQVIPLRKPSHLDQRAIAQFLLTVSDGLTREVDDQCPEGEEALVAGPNTLLA